MQSNIKLVVIKDALDYAQSEQASHIEKGDDLFLMLKNIYPSNIPPNTRWYLNNWNTDSDVTPQNADDIKKLNEMGGTVYVVTYPGDPVTAIITAISIVVSVAVAFLMPMPTIPGSGAPISPPSPNNALAQRTNRERMGGRVPAIFGEITAIPDLVAQNYSVYIDNQEIEYSAMCLGEGYYDVLAAKDGETSVGLISGANVRVYNPGLDTVTDIPSFEFGNLLTVEEQQFDNLAPARYSSVNGQVLTYPEDYLICNNNIIFKPPNIIQITSGATFNTTKFKSGEILQVEDAELISAPSGKSYNLSGFYTILTATSTQLTLSSPELVNTAWATLQSFDTQTNASSPVLSTEGDPLWQGWHYIEDNELDIALLNFTSPQGIYTVSTDGTKFAPFEVVLMIEVQGLDENLKPYPNPDDNTQAAKYNYTFSMFGRNATLNSQGTAYVFTTSEEARRSVGKSQKTGLFKNVGGSRLRVRRYSPRLNLGKQSIFDEIKFVDLYASKLPQNSEHTKNSLSTLVKTKTRATEGATSLKERKLSLLVQRRVRGIVPWSGEVVSMGDVQVNDRQRFSITLSSTVDFKGVNSGVVFIKAKDSIVKYPCYRADPSGSYLTNKIILPFNFDQSTQEQGKEIAISASFYFALTDPSELFPDYFDLSDVNSEGLVRLNPDVSKRIDDIIYHIATSSTTGGLTANDLNMTQITAEVDAQIAYFGTDLCAQFCGTFDSTDISTEEMIQTVAGAGFFTAYRINNKIHLHFEREEQFSTVSFNSHNITPDSFEYAESFGSRDDYDAVEVTYTSPKDDAKLTLMHPPEGGVKVQKVELVGVRNNVQAHIHLMRLYRKNLHSYKTCSFTGADESAIVLPTNRIDVANQYRADTQQGIVVDCKTITGNGRQALLTLSEPVSFGDSDFETGTLYVQTTDAKVESVHVFGTANPYLVEVGVLSEFSGNVSIGHDSVVNATYRFVPKLNISNDQDGYLVTKKEPGENPFTHRLTCINYSNKYYQNDQDFIRGYVTLDN